MLMKEIEVECVCEGERERERACVRLPIKDLFGSVCSAVLVLYLMHAGLLLKCSKYFIILKYPPSHRVKTGFITAVRVLCV